MTCGFDQTAASGETITDRRLAEGEELGSNILQVGTRILAYQKVGSRGDRKAEKIRAGVEAAKAIAALGAAYDRPDPVPDAAWVRAINPTQAWAQAGG